MSRNLGLKVLTAMRPEKAPAIEYIPLLCISFPSSRQNGQLTRTVQVEIPDGIWDTRLKGRTSIESVPRFQ